MGASDKAIGWTVFFLHVALVGGFVSCDKWGSRKGSVPSKHELVEEYATTLRGIDGLEVKVNGDTISFSAYTLTVLSVSEGENTVGKCDATVFAEVKWTENGGRLSSGTYFRGDGNLDSALLGSPCCWKNGRCR